MYYPITIFAGRIAQKKVNFTTDFETGQKIIFHPSWYKNATFSIKEDGTVIARLDTRTDGSGYLVTDVTYATMFVNGADRDKLLCYDRTYEESVDIIIRTLIDQKKYTKAFEI